MLPQQKILRVFKLISHLKSDSRKTVSELAKLMETTDRSIYRYFELLDEIGFAIDKDFENRFFIQMWDEHDNPVQEFSLDESKLLSDMLKSTKHPLKNSLLEKIHTRGELPGMAKNIVKAKSAKIISTLTKAMELHKQVILKKYHSARSNTLTDRLVEPVCFTDNYMNIAAFEPANKDNRHFKIDRIGEVELSDKLWKHEAKHQKPEVDLFGMGGNKETDVLITMGHKAYLLFIEEIPNGKNYITKKGNNYILQCKIYDTKGIVRFLAGVVDDIIDVDPAVLKKALCKHLDAGAARMVNG
ncbi:MAG: WYL domain-containing protein [Bacteroidota bacterium]|nr:WYL domain-containing protein [Bacteroidota bacterium]